MKVQLFLFVDVENGTFTVPANLSDYGKVWMRAAAVIRHSDTVLRKANDSEKQYGLHEQTDFAILRLESRIEFGPDIQPVFVPRSKEEYQPIDHNGEFLAIGWGDTARM